MIEMSGQRGKKKKIIKRAAAALALGGGFYIASGWPFFQYITYVGKKKPEKKKKTDGEVHETQTANRKKWFALNHTTINHPRHGYEEEYERGKAWCKAQKVQDWYIRSMDKKLLHASYRRRNRSASSSCAMATGEPGMAVWDIWLSSCTRITAVC